MKRIMGDIKSIPVKLNIDTSDLDTLISKANQLKALLREVKELAALLDVKIMLV